MLSPKVQRMQRTIRINEGQLLGLAEKARYDSRLAGVLHKRCADSNKWLLRWFRLYQVSSSVNFNDKNSLLCLDSGVLFLSLFSWFLSGTPCRHPTIAAPLSALSNQLKKINNQQKQITKAMKGENLWSLKSSFVGKEDQGSFIMNIYLQFVLFSEPPVLLRQRTVFETHWGYLLRRMFLWTCFESGHSSRKIRPKQTLQWKNGKIISFQFFLKKKKEKKMSSHLFSISVLLRNYVSTWKPTAIWIEGWHCLRM